MKTALFDCFSGVSGDMILGAMIDAGLPEKKLFHGLAGLGLKGVKLEARKDSRGGICGTRVHVNIVPAKGSRSLAQILELIRSASLPAVVQKNASAIFTTIGRVESKVHRVALAKIHFHEIGASDSIVDIVGACHGIFLLGLEKILFTPPALGYGWVQTEHGKFPVPGPATIALLRGIPARWGTPGPGEYTTPTGAAILSHFGQCIEESTDFAVRAVGYGIGQRNPQSHPNVLRMLIGDIPQRHKPQAARTDSWVWSLQTNIDDMQPQWYGPILEKLFQAGALDVFTIPIQMKKNRPGTILEVLCDDARRDKISDILLRETTTFGIRMQKMERRILEREIRTVRTRLGPMRFKIGKLHGKTAKIIPEFEDCLRVSRQKDIPLAKVYQALADHL